MKQLKLMLATVFVGIAFLSFIDDKNIAEVGLDIGNEAPAIKTQTIDGVDFDLNEFKGKMVIINFWASYHAQSRMNNYQLTQINEQYSKSSFRNGQDLVIVNISLDRFKSPMNLAIEQDEIAEFIQICDFTGKEGEVAQAYQINAPVNILLDGEGRILAKDAGLSKIEKSLNTLSAI
ncbi:TlpA family protein disulfide reductase [Carboxylicivirga caseinilyticus]|uniref:TlpA family protein disulfide reductase n=1 Tax=Carboxylicivirga caseinilyticus TaxID=3417572 RepID=UPI003D33A9CB|nr:TlpA family protein disulfide reductase [Marinilabiliaceae bacterium A049]